MIAEVLSRKLTFENCDKVFDRVEEEFCPGWGNQFPVPGDIIKYSKIKCPVCLGEGKYISKQGFENTCTKCKGVKEIPV